MTLFEGPHNMGYSIRERTPGDQLFMEITISGLRGLGLITV